MHPPPHPAALDPEEFLAQCDVTPTRGSGPGGQRRNKVETAVRMVHRPSGIAVTASERRSSQQNRRVALLRLRVKVALEVRCAAGRPYHPSPMWLRRCGGGAVSVNPSHDDFPAMLAEALDVIAACTMDVSAASESLSCTSSQLVKLLKLQPAALALVNQRRGQQGLHPMH